MNISAINKSELAFGSNYKFTINKNNYAGASAAIVTLALPQSCNNDYAVYTKYPSAEQKIKNGVYEIVYIIAGDRYDHFIEANLRARNIKFTKTTKTEALNPNNINNRTVLPDYCRNQALVNLDTKKIDKIFEQNEDYIPKGTKDSYYTDFQEYLTTARDIEAVQMRLTENRGKLNLEFLNGDYKYAVMRDMKMPTIRVALDKDSQKLAQKYGLIKN